MFMPYRRNAHNWMKNGTERAVFNAMFMALKSGGVLGVTEHSVPEWMSEKQMIASGYVSDIVCEIPC